MLINLYNQLFVMSVVAGGLYLILKLLSGLTMKCFALSWHYYTYTGIYMFLLLPYHKLLALFRLNFNQNAGNGLVLPTLPSILKLPSPSSNDLETVADKTEGVLSLNFDFLPYLLMAGTVIFIAGIIIQNIKLYRRIFSVCRLADEAQFKGILSKCKHEIGISKEVLLYTSPYARTPFLYGVLKPRIVLPDIEFTTEELQHMFYHELTHWKRHDPWLKFLMLLVNAIHWFNPLAYIARYDIERFCELSCDENVTTSMNTEERRRYCELMLSVLWNITDHNVKLLSAFSDKRKQLERRIDMIMKIEGLKNKKWVHIIAITIVLSLVLTGAVVAYAVSDNGGQTNTVNSGGVIASDPALVTEFGINASDLKFIPAEAFSSDKRKDNKSYAKIRNLDSNLETYALIFGDHFIAAQVGDKLPTGVYVNEDGTEAYVFDKKADGNTVMTKYKIDGNKYKVTDTQKRILKDDSKDTLSN